MTFNKRYTQLAILFLGSAVLIGAFGAHGLEKTLEAKALTTFQTGVTYQFYHGLALLVFSMYADKINNSRRIASFICLGILLFSFNCYLYAITGIKTFAMIVPLGGVSFAIAWILFFFQVTNVKDNQ